MSEQTKSRLWFHATYRDAETWDGPYDTREQAADAARATVPGAPVWVRQGELVTLAKLTDGDWLVEKICELIEDEWMDNYSAPEDGGELIAPLDMREAAESLTCWAEDHLTCEPWWEMTGDAEEVQP